jgi:hypothetical protein
MAAKILAGKSGAKPDTKPADKPPTKRPPAVLARKSY